MTRGYFAASRRGTQRHARPQVIAVLTAAERLQGLSTNTQPQNGGESGRVPIWWTHFSRGIRCPHR